MTINLDDLDALEAVARAATPGPWTINWETYEYHAGMPDKWASSINGPEASEFADLDSADAEHIAAFDPPTVLALIAEVRRLRESEKQRDDARWAAGIVGDVAREASNGWQDASAELHATEVRLWEAEAVIERARGWAEKPISGFTVENQIAEVADALASYEPTNQEGSDGA